MGLFCEFLICCTFAIEMALIEPGEKYGQLEIIEEATPDYYRCRCLRCRYDGALATVDALLTRKVTQCFDCNAQSKMSDSQKILATFKRSLDITPEWEMDNVDALPDTPSSLTIAEAIAA